MTRASAFIETVQAHADVGFETTRRRDHLFVVFHGIGGAESLAQAGRFYGRLVQETGEFTIHRAVSEAPIFRTTVGPFSSDIREIAGTIVDGLRRHAAETARRLMLRKPRNGRNLLRVADDLYDCFPNGCRLEMIGQSGYVHLKLPVAYSSALHTKFSGSPEEIGAALARFHNETLAPLRKPTTMHFLPLAIVLPPLSSRERLALKRLR